MNLALKKSIHTECLNIVDQKLATIKNEFKLYQDSAANETKSTAGDKHDTGKAMMQMEQEKLGVQLKELLNNKNILLSINPGNKLKHATSGSMIKTNYGNFYIAISLGKILLNGDEIFIISMQSPLAKVLFNKVADAVFDFNGKTYRILEIC